MCRFFSSTLLGAAAVGAALLATDVQAQPMPPRPMPPAVRPAPPPPAAQGANPMTPMPNPMPGFTGGTNQFPGFTGTNPNGVPPAAGANNQSPATTGTQAPTANQATVNQTQPMVTPNAGATNPFAPSAPMGVPFTNPQGTGISQQGTQSTATGTTTGTTNGNTNGTTTTTNQSNTGNLGTPATTGTSTGATGTSNGSKTTPAANGATGQGFGNAPPPLTDDSSFIRRPQAAGTGAAGASAAGATAAAGTGVFLNTGNLLRGLATMKVSSASNLNGGDIVNIGSSFNRVQTAALTQSLKSDPKAQQNAQALTQMLQQHGLISRNQYAVGFVGGKVYIADATNSSSP